MKTITRIFAIVLTCAMLLALSLPALAAEVETAAETAVTETAHSATDTIGSKAWPAAIVVAVVAAFGAAGMAVAIAKATSSMARQPEAADKINSAMMLGLVFIETLAIYALIVAILIVFVL